MEIIEFKKRLIKGRQSLLEQILATFSPLHPIAIHQFGSGAKAYQDEFSDLDIWITFPDDKIQNITSGLRKTFIAVAPVLVRHHSRSWSPVGGSADSILYQTEFGLFIVDFYISPISQTIIPLGSKVLFGSKTLPEGNWRLTRDTNKNIHDTHSKRKDVDLLINLIFISIKGIIRKWTGDELINTMNLVHKNLYEKYPSIIKHRHISLTFSSDQKLLSDLSQIANKR